LVLRLRIALAVKVLDPYWRRRHGINVKMAESREDLMKAYRFRYEVFRDQGFIDPADFPEGSLEDECDANSMNMLAFKDEAVVGIVRLILPEGAGLFVPRAFNLVETDLPLAETGEVSKICIASEIRGTEAGRAVLIALMAEVYRESLRRHIGYWLMGVPSSLARYFRTMGRGLSFQRLEVGPPTAEHLRVRTTIKRYAEKVEIVPFFVRIV
jgi:N-acyl-L-homoserine lactone synthetase